jgi:hypothetical protein
MNVIPADHAHGQLLEFNRCAGSDTWPTVDDGTHGLCDTCQQPFRLWYGAIPHHRTRRD